MKNRKLLLMGAIVSLLIPLGVLGQIWNGSVSTSWCNAANWTGGLPTASSDVTIYSGKTVEIPVGCDALAGNLTVLDGVLTIYGTLTVSNQISSLSNNIIIKDGGSMVYNSTSNYQPMVSVERIISGSNKYHYISSPVENPSIGAVFPAAQHDNIWLRNYNEAGGMWEDLSITNNMSTGIGYSFYMDEASTTATFSGKLNVGAKTVNLSYAYTDPTYEGYNLIGNPFPSAIDGDLLTRTTNVSSSVWVWNSNSGNYITWNGSAGGLTNGIIPSCQGFFVRATALSQSITISKDDQLHGTTALYKNALPNTLVMRVTSNQNSYNDAAYVVFNEQATMESDLQFDAEKLYGLEEAPQLYTKVLDTKYTTNYLPSIEQISLVPLCLESGIDATFSFKAEGMESFNGTNITLTDKKTGFKQTLNINPVYTFDFTNDESSDRFVLGFEPLGLKEKQELNMGIYSTGNVVKVKFDELTTGDVIIAGLTGQALHHERFSKVTDLTLNTQLPEGVYLITVTTDDKTASRKVFIK